jgi:hypothetical protein
MTPFSLPLANTIRKHRRKRISQDVTALSQECEYAESCVVAIREVIKELLDAERECQRQKTSMHDVLQSRNWKETYGSTALWLYNMIFARAFRSLPSSHRLVMRGRVKTISVDENAPDSDSEHCDEPIDHISADLERELYVYVGLKRTVVTELLQRWMGLEYGRIRPETDSTSFEKMNRVQKSIPQIVRWYLDNDDSAQENENAQPTRANSRGRLGNRGQGTAQKEAALATRKTIQEE